MNRVICVAALIALVLAGARTAQTKAAARGPRLEAVTFVVRHRVFHDFVDEQRVRLNQEFLLGDSDYNARVVEYVPDFQMDLATRKVVSRTGQPNNPAFKIIVRQGRVPQDTTWAFLNMPPHFGRRSYFAFQVLRIDFADHAPLLADTSAASGSRALAPAAPRAGADSAAKDTARHP